MPSGAMAHSGPDDEGFFADARPGPGRQAAGGHRPVRRRAASRCDSADGRYVMVYNGEIYNYVELAQRLRARGVQLRSRSEAEVLLEMYAG